MVGIRLEGLSKQFCILTFLKKTKKKEEVNFYFKVV